MDSFSVVMSVYRNDKPEFVACSVDSVSILQTKQPNEIVLVVDGPVPMNLDNLIRKYEQLDQFNVIRLKENRGLGNALRLGVEAARNEIIARMDSDDVSLPDRFEKQLAFLKEHPECDIVGGQITEFIDEEKNIVAKRIVPCGHDEITKWIKHRCPFNHVSVMMRRSRVLAVGNYIDWHYNEDYYLWIRMYEFNVRFANIPDTLVNVRVGMDMYRRRGGWRYFKSEAKLQDYMYYHGIISFPQYLYNVLGRFAVQLLIPSWLRGYIFQKVFRKR